MGGDRRDRKDAGGKKRPRWLWSDTVPLLGGISRIGGPGGALAVYTQKPSEAIGSGEGTGFLQPLGAFHPLLIFPKEGWTMVPNLTITLKECHSRANVPFGS